MVALSWLFWLRESHAEISAKWRTIALFIGLPAATLNAALLVFWAIWLHFHFSPESLRLENACGDAGDNLCLTGFLGSAAGEDADRARILIGISAVMGFLVWTPVGIL